MKLCCGIILPYSVNMYYSHQLIINLIWPIARQNKARQESQTKNTERKKGGVRDESQLPEEQDIPRGQVKPQIMWQNID